MKPMSDHNLVTFTLTMPSAELITSDNPKDIPEAATFNYDRANKDKVKQAINTSDWEQKLLNADHTKDVKTTSVNYCGPAINCNGLIIT